MEAADKAEKNLASAETFETVEGCTASDLTGMKRSFFQNLSLWSGTSRETLFSHLMRPWLLGAYPAVIWATVACKSLQSCHQSLANNAIYRWFGSGVADWYQHCVQFRVSGSSLQLFTRDQRADQYSGSA